MKRILHKMALVWISLLSIMGFSKTKLSKAEKDQAGKAPQQQEIMLDEYELSAFHSN
ncbi:MAG: hypothetical protein SFU87_05700 [Chitinophagaceae bacterium]|jgi:hypothetical protein|nr:hypothetical protein [Chitinophagaceae bacterium]